MIVAVDPFLIFSREKRKKLKKVFLEFLEEPVAFALLFSNSVVWLAYYINEFDVSPEGVEALYSKLPKSPTPIILTGDHIRNLEGRDRVSLVLAREKGEINREILNYYSPKGEFQLILI